MYQLYTQPRPGRPALAILSTAILLVLTVGMAWGLIQYKSKAHSIPLADPLVLSEAGIRCRLPSGWEATPANQLPPGIAASLIEPMSSDGTIRQLVIFRGAPRPVLLPSTSAAPAVGRMIQEFVPRARVQVIGFGRIGKLPGWTVMSLPASSVTERPLYCIGRAALAPQGQILGVLLVSSGPIRSGDRRLIEQVSENFELFDVQPTDGEIVMSSAGIEFTKPDDAVFFSEAFPIPRVQMIGGEGQEVWYLDVHCVPLMGTRTPAALVTDHCLSSLNQTVLSEPVESMKFGQRDFAEFHFSVFEGAKPSVMIACAQTEEHTALLFVGRYEQGAQKVLRDLVHAIAAEAVVKPYGQRINLAAAEDAGRRSLQSIASEGLAADFSVKSAQVDQFAIQSATLDLGRESRQMVSGRQDGDRWWNITVKLQIEPGDVVLHEAVEEWNVRDDGAAHAFGYQFKSPLSRGKYLERREPDAAQVHRELTVVQQPVYRDDLTVSDTYAPEPVLMRAAARMAWTLEAEPAIFRSTEIYAKELVYWLITSAGRARQSGESGELASVRLQRDFDPSPVTLYFDEQRMLVAIASDSGKWHILEGQALPVDLVR